MLLFAPNSVNDSYISQYFFVDLYKTSKYFDIFKTFG